MPSGSWPYILIPDHSVCLFPLNFNYIALLDIFILNSDESL